MYGLVSEREQVELNGIDDRWRPACRGFVGFQRAFILTNRGCLCFAVCDFPGRFSNAIIMHHHTTRSGS